MSTTWPTNIIHLVLARLPDAPPGIKGVSLFIVPKFRVNADGSLGQQRNSIYCAGLEHKMGITATPPAKWCSDGAYGTMVGSQQGHGWGMFVMMNAARLGVGNQSLGLTEVAYQIRAGFTPKSAFRCAACQALGQGPPADPPSSCTRRAQSR